MLGGGGEEAGVEASLSKARQGHREGESERELFVNKKCL